MRLASTVLLLVLGTAVAGGVSAAAKPPAAADLVVTVTTPDPAVGVGKPATFTVAVANRGPGRANGVVLVVRLAGAEQASASGRHCALAATTVTCRLGALAKGSRVAVQVEATTGAAGSLAASARVSAKTRDPRPRNNAATTSLRVLASDTVRGSGVRPTYTPSGNSPFRVRVEVDATSAFDGEDATGTFATRYPNGDPDLRGHVVCVAVSGNRATVGGIIDSASGTNVPATPVGSGVLLDFTDNGEPGVGRDTQISYIGVPADDARNCMLGDQSFELQLTDGNFTVHDESL